MPRTLFRTRIKFCGLTRPGDVRLAGELGADAIGFVFAGDSPRTVRAEEARAMRNALAPLVDAVAVFRDNPAEEVRDVVRLVRPSLLQFHGDEDDAFCRNFGVPYVKALALGSIPMTASTALQSRFPNASAFLFDGDRAGTGEVFDWSKIPTGLGRPFILAGGLTPANVHGAVVDNLPWGVDVSTGIESAPGLKDGELMRKFVSEVRRADCEEDPDTECEA